MTDRNIFARSPLSLSAVVVAAATLLAILTGLAVLFGAMLSPSRPPGAEALPSSLLLTAILVTLVVIAVLLAALLWHVSRGVRRA